MVQQIYDVLPGRPFGRGVNSVTYGSDPNVRTTATSSGATVYLGSAILQNGDLAVIHQTWGVSSLTEDNWEVFLVNSGGGTGTVVASQVLGRNYTAGAQVVKISEVFDAVVNSSFGGKSYGATVNTGSDNRYTAVGGLNVIAVKHRLTLNAVIHQNGYQGYISNSDRGGMNEYQHFYWWYANAPSGGHVGGANSTDDSAAACGGNSYYGYTSIERRESVGNGGGAGWRDSLCGAGGGHAYSSNWASDGGGGGAGPAGNDTLSSLHFGGGGGGPKGSNANAGMWTGASGAGIWIIFAREVVFGVNGGIQVNGGPGFANNDHAGGPGAGGGVLINCERMDMGSNKISALAGTAYIHAGAASVGRIRVNYGAWVTGSTSLGSYTNGQNVKLMASPKMAGVI